MNKKKSINISVNPKFYQKIERERKKFMKNNNLTRLTTTAFTGILDAKLIKRRRNDG